MGIGASGIEDDGPSRVHIDTNILFPQIAMYQCRRDLPAVRLQDSQESRYNNIDKLLASGVVLWPWTVSLIVISDNVLQLMSEGFRPTSFPGCCTF